MSLFRLRSCDGSMSDVMQGHVRGPAEVPIPIYSTIEVLPVYKYCYTYMRDNI